MARRAALAVMEAGVTLVVTGMDRPTPGVKVPGRASGGRLLGSRLDAFRDHLRLVHSAAADDIKRLLAWSGEAHALRRHAGGNRAEQFSLRTEDSDSCSGCNSRIQPASVVDASPSPPLIAKTRGFLRLPSGCTSKAMMVPLLVA